MPVRTESALSERLTLQVTDERLADVGSEHAGALDGSAWLGDHSTITVFTVAMILPCLGCRRIDLPGWNTMPEGRTQDGPANAGSVQWSEAGKHLPENLGDKPFELILVELKTKGALAK